MRRQRCPNLDADSSQASIAGKGVSSNSGHTITYDCGAEHQVIMCVYYAVPMLDWNLTGQAPQLTVTAISDFPQPAFDQLGMQAVPAMNLQNNPGRVVSGSLGIFFKISCKYFQNFCAEGIFALSSGECAPLIVGPKLTISIFG